MSRDVYEYAVELKVTNKNTKSVKLVTSLEHAYSVSDAAMQAMLALSSEASSSDVEIVRIQPPLSAILASSAKSVEIANKIMDRLAHNEAKRLA